MTPGEEQIYDYVVGLSAEYACMNVQVSVLNEVLKKYGDSQITKIKNMEEKVVEVIKHELDGCPLIDVYSPIKTYEDEGLHRITFGPLSMLINDIMRGIEYQTCSQGWWYVDPLGGRGVRITYDMFQKKCGVSKDVAKDCIQRLMDRGKVRRVRGLGGYEYTVDAQVVYERMCKNPGKWKPLHYNEQKGCYEEHKSLRPVIEHAQKELEDIQEYYVRRIRNSMKND